MKLYGTPPTRAIRALWLINELALECENVMVKLTSGEHLSPEFLSLNPVGKVPVLVDGDLQLFESVAIALYLAEKDPQRRFIPERLEVRAQMYQWLFFLVNEVEGPLWRIARHTSIYPEADRLPGEVRIAERECRKALSVFDSEMTGRDYVAGEALSVADFVAAYTLDWAREVGFLQDFPRLLTLVETMYQRAAAPPTIKAAFAALKESKTQQS